MVQMMKNILDFFLNKSADCIFDTQMEVVQTKKLEKEIMDFADKYFLDNFSQIPLSQEFDYERLNDFLHQNLINNVICCFNAADYKKREFFRDQLFRQAYEYSQADTREIKNTVKVYIENVLAIVNNFFVVNVDDNNWFLAGRTVDEIRKSNMELLSSYSSQIKEFLSYYGSFAETVDNIKHHLDIDNEYHYLRKTINFQGRKDDLEYLDNFLSADDDFLITAITGQGGIGKSKLMHYYMLRETGNLEWKIVFPARKQIELIVKQHKEWRYPKNLLFIIDYVGENAEVIGEWISLLNHTKERPPKMRIVMLERQGITTDVNGLSLYPHWFKQILNAAGHNFNKLLYQGQKFHALEPLQKDDLFSLMDNIAENQKKNISIRDKTAVYEHAVRMGNKEKHRFATPLMTILLTDAFLNGKSLGQLDSKNLMDYIIEKHQNYWLNSICGGNKDYYTYLEEMIVYATAIGGWDLKPLPEPLSNASTTILNSYNRSGLRLLISGVSEYESQEMILPPLVPDIVGEYLVLWYLKENTTKTYYFEFVRILWRKQVEFTSFLNRCINSYLCDSEFVELVEGENSLFSEWSDLFPSYCQSLLLVNLSYKLSLERCKKVVEMSAALARDERYSGNQEIVLTYAQGLFNLSNEQEVKEREASIEKLAVLARDERYSGNKEIVLTYAQGLVNLSIKQKVKESEASIERLAALAHDERYSGNQEIVLRYAQGLFLTCPKNRR